MTAAVAAIPLIPSPDAPDLSSSSIRTSDFAAESDSLGEVNRSISD